MFHTMGDKKNWYKGNVFTIDQDLPKNRGWIERLGIWGSEIAIPLIFQDKNLT